MTSKEALELAIRTCGTAAELARRLEVSAQAISQWDEVPPTRVLVVEKVTGVSRTLLRPDLYPAEEAAA